MSALHIGFDHNFIEHSRRVFEEYYPNTNTFVILKKTGALRIIKHPENFVILNLYDERNFGKLWKLCVDNDIDKIVFHGCSIKFASILKFLQTKRSLLCTGCSGDMNFIRRWGMKRTINYWMNLFRLLKYLLIMCPMHVVSSFVSCVDVICRQ